MTYERNDALEMADSTGCFGGIIAAAGVLMIIYFMFAMVQKYPPTETNMERTTVTLSPEYLRDLLDDNGNDEFDIVVNKITDTSRWAIHHRLVIYRKTDQRYFETHYRTGATEYQEESPFEYEDEVTLREVFAVEKTVIVFE